MARVGCTVAVWLLAGLAACSSADVTEPIVLTVSGSAVGAEGEVLTRQLARFERAHPGVAVEIQVTPDAADQRHQLYVQWLNAGASRPDVLQLDVIWTPEMAAAGWIRPFDESQLGADDFFAEALRANRWSGRLWATPLFVDVGMLYWRTDRPELVDGPPATFDELAADARRALDAGLVDYGLVWQGQRYEGLVTVFLEYLVGHGGRVLDPEGRVVVDEPAAVAALETMRGHLNDGIVPEAALAWQEEQTRFRFQAGRALFMRNWPYAWPLLQADDSNVAGRVAVAPMPAGPGGRSAATLGGAQLAVNANSRHPALAAEVVRFLTAPEQMIERAELAGQYPARRSVYDDPRLADALAIPPSDVRRVIEQAVARPTSPLYQQLSSTLQVHLHRALSGQAEPREALAEAAAAMRDVLAALEGPPRPLLGPAELLGVSVLGALVLVAWLRTRRRPAPRRRTASPGLAHAAAHPWLYVAPALVVIALMALVPLLVTAWESLFQHDLRLPDQGRPFVGLANYAALLTTPRFWEALAHTAFFTAVGVALELLFGLALALALDRVVRGRALFRVTVLLPWAIPTVVAALVWQFLFADAGLVNAALESMGLVATGPAWFGDALLAWFPIVLADVWKTTPFVALLLLAGLQNIDDGLYEAAQADGATPWQRFVHVTLPLLRPALLVVVVFRVLDALRVFDLIVVLTGGGPGTATEPLALYTFQSLLQHLRFGYGSAVSVVVFALSFGLALAAVRLLGRDLTEGAR